MRREFARQLSGFLHAEAAISPEMLHEEGLAVNAGLGARSNCFGVVLDLLKLLGLHVLCRYACERGYSLLMDCRKGALLLSASYLMLGLAATVGVNIVEHRISLLTEQLLLFQLARTLCIFLMGPLLLNICGFELRVALPERVLYRGDFQGAPRRSSCRPVLGQRCL